MSKLFRMAAVAFALAGGLMLSMPAERAVAQSAGLYVNAVDLDIAPDQMDAFLAAIKENGAASVKEPGCHAFNITVQADKPNHVFLFEVYDNEAALAAHRQTDHFKKYQATTGKMVTGRSVRPLTSVAFNSKAK
jgi:autoinducer 2-degrading protein